MFHKDIFSRMTLLCFLLLPFSFVGAFEVAQKTEKSLDPIKQPITPSFYGGVIHLSDLNTSATAGAAMYTIQSSGRYYVSSDLSLAPDNARVAGIKIDASNVLLELNSAIIYQRNGNSQTGLIGIEVDSNIANVRIQNGVINGLNVADSTEQNGGVVVQSGANNIKIENVIVSGCTSATHEASGFLLSSCNNVKLINCESSNNTNTLASATDNNGSVNGFKLDTCNGCVLQECYANRNNSTDQNAYGFRLESSKYNKVMTCNALNQVSGSGDSGDMAAGFYSSDGAGNLFESCTSNGNTGGSNSGCIGAGFVLGDNTATNEKYSAIVHCRAEGNDGGTGDGYGISVTSGVQFCEVREDIMVGNTGSNSGYGIRDENAQANTNTIYIKNFAAHNGKNDGTTINNYSVSPAPSGSVQVKQGNYNSYTGMDAAETGFFNVEIIE